MAHAATPSGDSRTIDGVLDVGVGREHHAETAGRRQERRRDGPGTEPDEVVPRRQPHRGGRVWVAARATPNPSAVANRPGRTEDRSLPAAGTTPTTGMTMASGVGHQPEPARDVDVDPVDPAGTEHVDPVGPGRPPGVRRTAAAGSDEQERPGRILGFDRPGVHPFEDAAGVDPPDPRVQRLLRRSGRWGPSRRSPGPRWPPARCRPRRPRSRAPSLRQRSFPRAGRSAPRLGDDRPDAEEIVGRDLGRDLGPGRLERAGPSARVAARHAAWAARTGSPLPGGRDAAGATTARRVSHGLSTAAPSASATTTTPTTIGSTRRRLGRSGTGSKSMLTGSPGDTSGRTPRMSRDQPASGTIRPSASIVACRRRRLSSAPGTWSRA